jgi:hypothetical protein
MLGFVASQAFCMLLFDPTQALAVGGFVISEVPLDGDKATDPKGTVHRIKRCLNRTNQRSINRMTHL